MTENEAIALAFNSETEQLIDSKYYGYCFIVANNLNEYALVDEECCRATLMPDFIKSEGDIKILIRLTNNAYKEGKERGKRSLRNELANLLDFTTRDRHDNLDEHTDKRISALEENA